MFARNIRREMTLYWGARQRSGLYSELPHKWAAQNPHFKYVPVISDAPEPGIRHNLVHKAVLEDHPSLAGFQAYVCGVPVMTQAAKREFSPPACRRMSSSPTPSSRAPRSPRPAPKPLKLRIIFAFFDSRAGNFSQLGWRAKGRPMNQHTPFAALEIRAWPSASTGRRSTVST